MENNHRGVVLRILHARTHFEVFDLSPEILSPEEIKRCYRQLALKVHPDKNSDEGAEAAFKRVALAFEVLVDPGQQALYRASLGDNTSSHYSAAPRHKKTWEEMYVPPSKWTSNKPTEKEKETGAQKKKASSVRPWEGFEEEERLFKAQAQAKRQQKEEEQEARKLQAEATEKARIQKMRNDMEKKDVETGAQNWKNFQKGKTSKRPRPNKPEKHPKGTTDISEQTLPKPDERKQAEISQQKATQQFACLVCRRAFASMENLHLHEAMSDLHRANVELKNIIDEIKVT